MSLRSSVWLWEDKSKIGNLSNEVVMKIAKRISIYFLYGLLLSGQQLYTQSLQNAGASGMQFLKIGVGARAMGMGGAYTSLAGDAASLAWNPAGIGTITQIQLEAEHTTWVEGTSHNFIGLVVPITEQFNLAFHTVYLNSGDIEITTIDKPEGTGTYYNNADISAGITSSVRLTSQLTFAATVKYVQERIYDVSTGGVAADAGAWYATGYRSLTIGFSVANLGFEQKFSGRLLEIKYTPSSTGEPAKNAELQTLPFSLPLTFRASGSFDLFEMFDEKLESDKFIVAMDFSQQSDTRERFILGGEYSWNNLIRIRSGYIFNADELSWNIGGGVMLDIADFIVSADYAASSLGRLGIGHRIGVSVGYK
jgi:hypothetical protein